MSKATVEVRYNQPVDRFAQGRISLVLYHPFFGTLAMTLILIRDELFEHLAGTNGVYLKYNPQRCADLLMPEVEFIWAHEVMHCAMGHHVRRGDRDFMLWNIACDYVVNLVLVEAGMQMPRGMLLDVRFKDMSAVQVYDVLLKEYEQKQQQQQQEEDDNEESEDGEDDRTEESNSGNDQVSRGGEDHGSEDDDEGEDQEDDEDEADGNGNRTASGKGDDESKAGSGIPEDQGDDSGTDAGESQQADGKEDEQDAKGKASSVGGTGKNLVPEDDPRLEASRLTGVVEDFTGDPNSPDDNIVTQTQRDQEEVSWRTVLNDCAQVAQAAGNLPDSMKQLIEEMNEHKISWTEILREFISKSTSTDYTWRIPNRHYIIQDLYAPSLNAGGIEDGVVATDTSGSTTPYWKQFSEEAGGVLQDFDTEMLFLQCDTSITNVQNFRSGDFPERPEIFGGGGTYFRPIFNYIEEEGITPKFLLFFTDGYLCDSYPPEPPYPVFWIMTPDGSRNKPPFGEVVWMEQKQLQHK
jgi:predicted metal-dependent peptidase